MTASANGKPYDPAKAGEGWKFLSDQLADWVWARLVNRRDVFGAYFDKDGAFHQYTATGLAIEDVRRHYLGERVIGFHSTSPDGRCKWFAVDIDAHEGDGADPERNLSYALHLARKLRGVGLTAFVLESNGRGGYHVWCLLKSPVRSDAVFQFVQRLVTDHAEHGLPRAPETFPKQAGVSYDQPYGNWLRGPGRHHKRDFWPRAMVFNPKAKGEPAWLEGEAAAAALVKLRPNPPEPILEGFVEPVAAKRTERPASVGKGGRGGYREGDKTPAEWVADALGYLPSVMADNYEMWLSVGMALHSWDAQGGYDLWLRFSQSCPGKFSETACADKWRSFVAEGGISIGYVFHHAKEAGWPPAWEKTKTKSPDRDSHSSHSSHSSLKDKDLRQKSPAPLAAPLDSPTPLPWANSTDEELGLVDLRQVKERPTEWLWKNMLALECLNLIAGPGDSGKSSIIRRIVSDGTLGLPLGPGAEPPDGPFRTIYASAEESLASIVKPRFMASGADISMISPVETGTTKGGRKVPFCVQDVDRIAEMLRRLPDTKLIVIDPISSYLGVGVDDNRNNEVRRVLVPLRELAEQFRVCVLMNHHFGKPSPGRKNLIDRILGSVGYKDVCRAAHVVVIDPEDESQALLVTPKNNLVARSERQTLAFKVVGVPFEFTEHGVTQDQGVAEWIGTDDRTVADLERAVEQKAEEKGRVITSDVQARLVEILQDGSPQPAYEIYAEFELDDVGVDKVKRAKKALSIKVAKSDFDGPWTWTLTHPETWLKALADYRRKTGQPQGSEGGEPKGAAKGAGCPPRKHLENTQGSEGSEGSDWFEGPRRRREVL